jgi:hypothetical protein
MTEPVEPKPEFRPLAEDTAVAAPNGDDASHSGQRHGFMVA